MSICHIQATYKIYMTDDQGSKIRSLALYWDNSRIWGSLEINNLKGMFCVPASTRISRDENHLYPVVWRYFREGALNREHLEESVSETRGIVCFHRNGEISGDFDRFPTSSTAGRYIFSGERQSAATPLDAKFLKLHKKKWKAAGATIAPVERMTFEQQALLDKLKGDYQVRDLENVAAKQYKIKINGGGSKIYGWFSTGTYCGWMLLDTPGQELEIETHMDFRWFGEEFVADGKKSRRQERNKREEENRPVRVVSSRGSLRFLSGEEFDVEVSFHGNFNGMGCLFRGSKMEKSKTTKPWVYSNGFKDMQEMWYRQKIASLQCGGMAASNNTDDTKDSCDWDVSYVGSDSVLSAGQTSNPSKNAELLRELKDWALGIGPEGLEELRELKDWEQSKSSVELSELAQLRRWEESNAVKDLTDEVDPDVGGVVL